MSKRYQSDLTDKQWAIIQPLIPKEKDGGRQNRTRYLWKEVEVEAAIQYVVNEQGLPMSVFENKNRTFIIAI